MLLYRKARHQNDILLYRKLGIGITCADSVFAQLCGN